MFLDRRCPGCNEPSRRICPVCRDALARQAAPHDEAAALARIAGLDALAAAFVYDDLVARIILAAKNGGRRDVLSGLGRTVAHLVPGRPGCVTWVPAAPQHLADRGYDQGKILARSVAAVIGVPARPLLRRTGAAQANRARADRLAGPAVAVLDRPGRLVPESVLLVDDVATTGSSLAVSARSLRGAGARWVGSAVVALSAGEMRLD